MRYLLGAGIALLLACAWLAACGVAYAQAPGVDRDWGIYARLAGTEFTSPDDKAWWRWGEDGDSIVEDRSFQAESVITRGAKPGELVMVYGRGLHTYDGRIGDDGSVVWVRRGWIKLPSRVALEDGRFIEQMVKVDDAFQVLKTNSTARFRQTGGDPVASVAQVRVPAPAAPATATASATASTPAAVALPPAVAAPAAAPVAAASVAAAPAVALDFAFLGALAGREFVEHDNRLAVSLEDGGRTLVLVYNGTDRYAYRHAAEAGRLQVDHPPGLKNVSAHLTADGKLVLEFKVPFDARYRYTYIPDDATSFMVRKEWKPGLLSGWEAYEWDEFFAATDENIEWQLREKGRREQQLARDAARREADQAQMQQALGAALGNVSDHLAREAEQEYRQQAFIADVQAEAALRAAIARREAAAAPATGPAASLPGADAAIEVEGETPAATEPAGTPPGADVAIELESEPPPASPAAAPAAAPPAPRMVVCMVLKPTEFDRHNGALFLSEIGPGAADEARASFVAKVERAYGVKGAVICESDPDRGWLEQKPGEWQRGHPDYKHVWTGMAPL